jgi:hypothetical protein
MIEGEGFREDSQAVQAHLTITQSIISRMSTNSASCKAWCLTLVSAIIVVVSDKDKAPLVLIALIPIALFLALDTYYLALERMFIGSYNAFIKKLHRGKVDAEDLFAVSPLGNIYKQMLKALVSFSIWPFYLTLVVMVWLAREIVL